MIDAQEKTDAYDFLKSLQQNLDSAVTSPSVLHPSITRTIAESKDVHEQRHLRHPEGVFLNLCVLPVLSQPIQASGLTEEDARHALLNEYHRSMPSISSASPLATRRHPFTKARGETEDTIYSRWARGDSALMRSCPDFALRRPFPHKILFEGKYFSQGSADRAQRELVADIYQAFFYRGLPFVDETPKGHAAWDYNYACLVTYDASPQGTLKKAWDALSQEVQSSFWDSACIYVMILGGQGRPVQSAA